MNQNKVNNQNLVNRATQTDVDWLNGPVNEYMRAIGSGIVEKSLQRRAARLMSLQRENTELKSMLSRWKRVIEVEEPMSNALSYSRSIPPPAQPIKMKLKDKLLEKLQTGSQKCSFQMNSPVHSVVMPSVNKSEVTGVSTANARPRVPKYSFSNHKTSVLRGNYQQYSRVQSYPPTQRYTGIPPLSAIGLPSLNVAELHNFWDGSQRDIYQ